MRERIKKYLTDLESELLSANKCRLILMSKEWVKSFPSEAGIYVMREDGNICFVEETSNLQNRFLDLLDTRHHIARRRVGDMKFKDEIGYCKENDTMPFSTEIEEELNNILEDNFEISVLVVPIGRKELEERIIEKCKPIYNKEVVKSLIESIVPIDKTTDLLEKIEIKMKG